MLDNQAIADEERRVRELQRIVDLALFYLAMAPLTRETAEILVAKVRTRALAMFPDKGEAFDLIYQPRLNRAIASRFGLH